MYKPFDKNLVDILAISKEHDTLQLINLVIFNIFFHFAQNKSIFF